jgi:hypothetical protein
MANASNWLDPAVVAADLAVAYPDAYVDRITNATAAYVERMRADRDYTTPENLPEDVVQASVELTCLEYQQRNAPSGFPGFGETGDGFALGSTSVDVYRLSHIYRRLGIKNPVTA